MASRCAIDAVSFDACWRDAVPDHWHKAGARTSPPSGYKSSRKAATPFHALVNYAYAILETEATITGACDFLSLTDASSSASGSDRSFSHPIGPSSSC